jgi:hypothetical protein
MGSPSPTDCPKISEELTASFYRNEDILKVKDKLLKHYAMKTYGGVEI